MNQMRITERQHCEFNRPYLANLQFYSSLLPLHCVLVKLHLLNQTDSEVEVEVEVARGD